MAAWREINFQMSQVETSYNSKNIARAKTQRDISLAFNVLCVFATSRETSLADFLAGSIICVEAFNFNIRFFTTGIGILDVHRDNSFLPRHERNKVIAKDDR